MNSRILKIGLTGVFFCSLVSGFSQQINPMTEAVLRNYNEILAENPRDYITLYDRASQYFDMGEYIRALSDIDMALDCTPSQDKDYLIAEYTLKSDILTSQKNYQGAIDAINQALALNSTSQAALYKLGNLYLISNNPAEALKAFQSLQRESPRSQEAFYGMAKANAMLGNTDQAVSLIQEIESLGKQSFLTYCRIGDLYADMGKTPEATNNYIIAYTMAENSQRPIESLKFLAKKDPEGVMQSLEGIIQQNSDNIYLNYAKAIIAFDMGLYSQAEKACLDLASNLEEESPAVYRMLAVSQLAQDKIDDAKKSIAKAELIAPDNAGVLLDKAEIYLSDNPGAAYDAAQKALQTVPDDESLLMAAAKAAMLSGKYQEALTLLNNVVLGNPSNVEGLLLRGYLNTEYLKDGKAGVADYTRAGNVKSDNLSDQVMAAIGKSKAGKSLDSEGIVNEAIQRAGGDKDALYMIAVYYAQTGKLEKAKEYADRAMSAGYGNLYNLRTNNQPLINLGPIHHLMGK